MANNNNSEDETTTHNSANSNDGIFQAFAQTTTVHGLQPIASSTTKTGKFIWSILLVVAFAYMLKSNIISVRRYLSFPFTTEVGEEFAGQNGIKFPSITVCPMNMFVKKKIELQDEHRLFHEFHLNLEICKETREARRKYNLTCGKLLMCNVHFYSMGGRDCGPNPKLILANYLKNAKNFSASNYEAQFRDVYGPNLKHSLIECRYGNDRCRASEFTTHISIYGKCFQYNGDSSNASWAFTSGKLFLVLNAKVDEYTESPFFTEGFRFYIQDQGTFISHDEGFVVSPGNIASVNVKQIKKTYLKAPYKSNCTDISLKGYSTYTILGCMNECWQEFKIKKCGCRSCDYLQGNSQIRVCTSNDSSCQRRILKYMFNPKNCDCRPPCSETTYDHKLSYSTFPDLRSTKMIHKHRKISIEYQRNNFVAIMIHFNAASYSTQNENETYTWEALLGEVGGNLGLMVGCSVLTGAEILQLVILLIYKGFQNVGKQRKVAWTTDST